MRNLKFGTVLPRSVFGGPLTLSTALQYIVYVGVNACCLLLDISFRRPKHISLATLEVVISRAGYLLLANMMPLFISPHLSIVSHSLRLSLLTVKNMHYACGLMSYGLFVLHSYSFIPKTSFSRDASDVYKLMVL